MAFARLKLGTTLNDGTEIELDLLNNENVSLQAGGHAPAVSYRQNSALAGQLYSDVQENIALNFFSTTAAGLFDPVQVASQLLDRADAWSKGERINPVVMTIQAQGSPLAEPLKVVVTGRGSSGTIQLDSSFNDHLLVYEIENFVLSFMRGGAYLGAVDSQTAVAVANPALLTVSMSERVKIPSPTRVAFTGFQAGTEIMGNGFLLITGVQPTSDFGTNLKVWEVGDMTPDAAWATISEGNHAPGGQVLRIDAASNQTGVIAINGVNARVEEITLFALVRNNNAASGWNVRGESVRHVDINGRYKSVGAATQPQWINLGLLVSEARNHQDIQVRFKTSATAGTLDVNAICVFPHDSSAHYVAVNQGVYSTASFPRSVVVDPRPLTHRKASLHVETG